MTARHPRSEVGRRTHRRSRKSAQARPRRRSTKAEMEARHPNFQKPSLELACSPAPQSLKFEREDWASFRTIEGLQQKAGVAKDNLFRLVLKELCDNSLDESGHARIGKLANSSGYFVEDDGRGIDGTPQDIAMLFSIAPDDFHQTNGSTQSSRPTLTRGVA